MLVLPAAQSNGYLIAAATVLNIINLFFVCVQEIPGRGQLIKLTVLIRPGVILEETCVMNSWALGSLWC